jgi:hypothetical protein
MLSAAGGVSVVISAITTPTATPITISITMTAIMVMIPHAGDAGTAMANKRRI